MLQANGQKRHLFFSRSFDKVALRTRKRAFEKYKRNFAVTFRQSYFLTTEFALRLSKSCLQGLKRLAYLSVL